jgi:hypothetical protein
MRLTFALDLPFQTRFQMLGPVTRRPTNELEVLRDVVHLLSFEIGHNDIYVVAAVVVHASEEHELR